MLGSQVEASRLQCSVRDDIINDQSIRLHVWRGKGETGSNGHWRDVNTCGFDETCREKCCPSEEGPKLRLSLKVFWRSPYELREDRIGL